MFCNCCDLSNGAISLINGNICIGVPVGIRVGNVNPPEGLTADDARTFGCGAIQRLKQRIVLVSVAVRPSVYGNCLNVASGVETSSGEHASELIANVAFENIKECGQQFVASCPILVFCR